MKALPSPPLDRGAEETGIAVSATGTDGRGPAEFAPKFAPTPDNSGKSGSISVGMAGQDEDGDEAESLDVSACPVKGKSPLTTAVNGLLEVGDTGLEPVTPSLSS